MAIHGDICIRAERTGPKMRQSVLLLIQSKISTIKEYASGENYLNDDCSMVIDYSNMKLERYKSGGKDFFCIDQGGIKPLLQYQINTNGNKGFNDWYLEIQSAVTVQSNLVIVYKDIIDILSSFENYLNSSPPKLLKILSIHVKDLIQQDIKENNVYYFLNMYIDELVEEHKKFTENGVGKSSIETWQSLCKPNTFIAHFVLGFMQYHNNQLDQLARKGNKKKQKKKKKRDMRSKAKEETEGGDKSKRGKPKGKMILGWFSKFKKPSKKRVKRTEKRDLLSGVKPAEKQQEWNGGQEHQGPHPFNQALYQQKQFNHHHNGGHPQHQEPFMRNPSQRLATNTQNHYSDNYRSPPQFHNNQMKNPNHVRAQSDFPFQKPLKSLDEYEGTAPPPTSDDIGLFSGQEFAGHYDDDESAETPPYEEDAIALPKRKYYRKKPVYRVDMLMESAMSNLKDYQEMNTYLNLHK